MNPDALAHQTFAFAGKEFAALKDHLLDMRALAFNGVLLPVLPNRRNPNG